MEKIEAEKIYTRGKAAVVKALSLQQEENKKQEEEIKKLQNQIKSLEQAITKLSKDSSTSHKPPSSDITKPPKEKKNPNDSEKKNKIGGQQGHPKHERELFPSEAVDHPHTYEVSLCPDCAGENLMLLDEPPRILQQVELQPILFEVTEHRSYAYYCMDCDQVHYAEFPEEALKAGLFKERLTALVAYMKNVGHASFSTIRKFIRDVLQFKVSRGYLSKLIQKVSQSLEMPYEELLNRLPLESKLNVDETGHKENGDLFWTWVFKAELYVLFRIDKSRGSEVLVKTLGTEFDGVLGCDYFSAYRKYMKDFNITIQFCLAHLIRDIRYLTTCPDSETKAYGKRLLEGVRKLFQVIHSKEESPEETFQSALEQAKKSLLKIALEEVPSELDEEGKELKREAHNLANRFRKHGDAYFQFMILAKP